MKEQTQTKLKPILSHKDLKALRLIQTPNNHLTAVIVKPEPTVIGSIPNDPEEFMNYKENARKILDKQSEHLNRQGIEFLVLALIEEVWGNENYGQHNERRKQNDDEENKKN